MKRKWSLFAGAVVLAGYFLISNGAPLPAVLLGIALAALWTGRRSHAV